MGIYSFYSTFISKLGPGVTNQTVFDPISGFSIDFNAVIHKVAQETFLYGEHALSEGERGNGEGGGGASVKSTKFHELSQMTAKEIEALFLSNLREEILYLLRTFAPRDYLIIAADGVTPAAKIVQQRQRRYRNVFNPVLPQIAEFFTPTAISPGSEFMDKIDKHLLGWFEEVKGTSPFPPLFIYSSHRIPGEGEHKICDLFREWKESRKSLFGSGNHVIYGKDSDLSMLSLLLSIPNIFLARDDRNDCINVDALWRKIRDFMTDEGKAPSSTFDDTTIKFDFILIAFLIGNDFLPRVLSVDKIATGRLNETYWSLGVPLTRESRRTVLVGPRGVGIKKRKAKTRDVLLSNFAVYLSRLATHEPALLASLALEQAKPEYQGKSVALQQSFDQATGIVDIEKFRRLFYAKVGGIRQWAFEVGEGRAKDYASLDEVVHDMCHEYLIVVKWVLDYYTVGDGGVNWDIYYPFISAPTLSDLAVEIVKEETRAEEGEEREDEKEQKDEEEEKQEPIAEEEEEEGEEADIAIEREEEEKPSKPSKTNICDVLIRPAQSPRPALALDPAVWEQSLLPPSAEAARNEGQAQWIREFQSHIFKIMLPVFPIESVRRITVSAEMMGIWVQAVTTPTTGVPPEKTYETYEMLGDKVMGYSFSEIVFRLFPKVTPGELTYLNNFYVSNKFQSQLSDVLQLNSWALVGDGPRDWLATPKARTDLIEAFCQALVLVSKATHRRLLEAEQYQLAACGAIYGSSAVTALLTALFATRPIEMSKAQSASKSILMDLNTLLGLRNRMGITFERTQDAASLKWTYFVFISRVMIDRLAEYGVSGFGQSARGEPLLLAQADDTTDANDEALRVLRQRGITDEWMAERRLESDIGFLTESQALEFRKAKMKIGGTKVIFKIPAATTTSANVVVNMTIFNNRDVAIRTVVGIGGSLRQAKMEAIRTFVESV